MREMAETHQPLRSVIVTLNKKEEEKWVTHYSSFHQILLVGEGDFSFSASLAQSFGTAFNIVATSLDSYDDAIRKYKHAKFNFDILEKLGAFLLHGVDVTSLKLHTDLRMRKFDRIIYNFPHAGFHGKENDTRIIKNLVSSFLRNAKGMLRVNGEIHVNHKMAVPFCRWNLKELGAQNSLALIETVPFKKTDYPGYTNKRGSGTRRDEPFHLGKCCTFKFIFVPTANKVTEKKNLDLRFTRPRESVEASPYVPQHPPSYFIPKTNDIHRQRSDEVERTPLYSPQQPNYIQFRSLPTVNVSNECFRILRGYFEQVKTFGGHDRNLSDYLHEAVFLGFEKYMIEERGKTAGVYINILEELRHFFIEGQQWATRMLVAPLHFQ